MNEEWTLQSSRLDTVFLKTGSFLKKSIKFRMLWAFLKLKKKVLSASNICITVLIYIVCRRNTLKMT